MNNEQPRAPDFKGDGVAVWVNQDKKSDNKYLSIKVVGHTTIYAWRPEPKEETKNGNEPER